MFTAPWPVSETHSTMKALARLALVTVFALMWSLGACSTPDESPNDLTPESNDAGDASPGDISEAADLPPLSDSDDPEPDGGDVPDVDTPDAAPDVSLPTEDVAEPEPEPIIPECEADVDCADGLTCCQGRCADLDSDRDHCGACGNACPVECGPEVCLKAVQISAGRGTTCALLNNGTVRCFGRYVGQETEQNLGSSRPLEVPGIVDALMVSCSNNHVCVIHVGGTVSCWGDNEFYQLARPGDVNGLSITPVGIEGVSDAVFVEAAEDGTCVVLSDGGVMCWGLTQSGRFGGEAFEEAVRIPAHHDVVNLSMTLNHALWLHDDGRVFVTGTPPYIRGIALTPQPMNFQAIQVGAGGGHSCMVDLDGDLWCLGDNFDYQIGPAPCNFCDEPQRVPNATDIVSLDLGDKYTCFINIQGQAFCFGDLINVSRNPPDVLGMPRRVSDIPEPLVQVSSAQLYSCALASSGRVYCWGSPPGLRDGLAKPIEW